jgi:hypothetical protein
MGREIKRVALDFDWPLNKVWKGFVQENPHHIKCPDCNYGYTGAAQWLEAILRLLTCAADDAVYAEGKRNPDRIFPHPYLTRLCNAPEQPPSIELVEFMDALEIKRDIFGYTGSDIMWKLLQKLDLPEDWGRCKTCGGDAIHPDHKDAMEQWDKEHPDYEPPEGEGYQIWETVSEGSPISPVFEEKEGMVGWLIEEGYTRKAAENFAKMSGAHPQS